MNRPTLRALARLLTPWRTIRRLEAQNQLLSDVLANPTITGIAIHQNEATIGGAGPGPQLLAGMFMGLLQDNPKAVNYVELTFLSPKGNILVTVHRPGGATPHNLRAMAEQEARNLRAELATAKEALRRLQRWGGFHGSESFAAFVLFDVIRWIEAGMTDPLPPLSDRLVEREQLQGDPEARC
jgi:hypothetical protein